MAMTLQQKSAFNDEWLQAWTDKDVAKIASMYAADCDYFDGANSGGLKGRAALTVYLEKLFPVLPEWKYTPDEIWEIDGGFCARWYLDMGGKRMRGFDFVKLKDGEIAYNEVYTHDL